jgi:hypothetical protein
MNALVLACMISILVVPQGIARAADLPEGAPRGVAMVDSVIPSDPGIGHAVLGSDPQGENLDPRGDGNPQDPPQAVSPATWGALKAVFGR